MTNSAGMEDDLKDASFFGLEEPPGTQGLLEGRKKVSCLSNGSQTNSMERDVLGGAFRVADKAEMGAELERVINI